MYGQHIITVMRIFTYAAVDLVFQSHCITRVHLPTAMSTSYCLGPQRLCFMPQSLIMFLPYTLSAQLNRQDAALQMQKEDTSIPGQLVHQYAALQILTDTKELDFWLDFYVFLCLAILYNTYLLSFGSWPLANHVSILVWLMLHSRWYMDVLHINIQELQRPQH